MRLLTAWRGPFNICRTCDGFIAAGQKQISLLNSTKNQRSLLKCRFFRYQKKATGWREHGIKDYCITNDSISRSDSEKYKRLRSINCKIWKLRRASKAVCVGGTRRRMKLHREIRPRLIEDECSNCLAETASLFSRG